MFTAELIELLGKYRAISVHEMIGPLYRQVSDTMMLHFNPQTMSPRLKHLKDTSGDFVFIAKPNDPWIEEAHKLLGEHRNIGGGTGRGTVNNGEQPEEAPPPEPDVLTEDELRHHTREVRPAKHKQRLLGDEHRAVLVKRTESFEPQARAGDANAMAAVFYSYAYGLGSDEQQERAYDWAQEDRDTNTNAGKLALALACKDGIGVEKNDDAIVQLFGEIREDQRQAGLPK